MPLAHAVRRVAQPEVRCREGGASSSPGQLRGEGGGVGGEAGRLQRLDGSLLPPDVERVEAGH